MTSIQHFILGEGKIISENAFRTQTYYSDYQVLKVKWLDKSTDLSESQFWEDLHHLTENIRNFNIQLLLVDCKDLHYTIPPQQQHLIAEKFSGLWADAGITKFASVHSEQLSVTASFEGVAEYAEDIAPVEFSYRFFDEMDEALRWLLKNNKT